MVWAAQGDIVQGYVINPNPMFDMSPSRDKTYCGGSKITGPDTNRVSQSNYRRRAIIVGSVPANLTQQKPMAGMVRMR